MKIDKLVIVILLFLPCCHFPQQFKFNEALKINPIAENQFYWPYYLFIPQGASAMNDSLLLFVIPNNTGRVSDSISVHEQRVLQTIKNAQMISDKLNAVLLVPLFPRPESNWKVYTHALDRDVMLTNNDSLKRLDLQLIKMIQDAKILLQKQDITVKEKIFMMGFSASAMFVNRFCFLHPEMVKAAAIGSPGGWPIVPQKNYNGYPLNYPVGINDFYKIAGKPFNITSLKEIKLYFFLGDKDENDSVLYDDGYDEPERQIILNNFGKSLQDRWIIAKDIYNKQGFMNAQFILYKDAGHSINNQIINDLLNFFSQVNLE